MQKSFPYTPRNAAQKLNSWALKEEKERERKRQREKEGRKEE